MLYHIFNSILWAILLMRSLVGVVDVDVELMLLFEAATCILSGYRLCKMGFIKSTSEINYRKIYRSLHIHSFILLNYQQQNRAKSIYSSTGYHQRFF